MKISKAAAVLILGLALWPRASFCAGADQDFNDLISRAGAELDPALRRFAQTPRSILTRVTNETGPDDPRLREQKQRINMVSRVKPSVVFLLNQLADKRTGFCSGFFINARGLADGDVIATNAHCVRERRAGDMFEAGLYVSDFAPPKWAKGMILAVGNEQDLQKDIAFIRLLSGDPRYRRTGLNLLVDKLDAAEDVIAIGHPYSEKWTVTKGIVSALHRTPGGGGPVLDLLQTDAALNQGNSGGPLFNLWGDVVGINSGILSAESGRPNGIGFAIPAKYIIYALRQFKRTGNLETGWAGLALKPADDGTLIVESVASNGPAAAAGIQHGDVLIQIEGKSLEAIPVAEEALNEFSARVKFKSPGESLSLAVKRAGQIMPPVRIAMGTAPRASAEQPKGPIFNRLLRRWLR